MCVCEREHGCVFVGESVYEKRESDNVCKVEKEEINLFKNWLPRSNFPALHQVSSFPI